MYLFSKMFTIHPAELRLHVHKIIYTGGSAVTSHVRNGLTSHIISCTAGKKKNMIPTNTIDHLKGLSQGGLRLSDLSTSQPFFLMHSIDLS